MGLFSTCFQMGFAPVFPTSFKRFLHLFWEQIFPIKRGVYQECFKSDFLEFSSTISILVFSHKHLSYPLLYLPIGIFVVRGFYVIKVLWLPKFHLYIWEGGLAGSRCFEFACELIVWGAASRCVLVGTREGLESPRVLVGTPCRYCSTEWSVGIDFSGNPS